MHNPARMAGVVFANILIVELEFNCNLIRRLYIIIPMMPYSIISYVNIIGLFSYE